MAELDYAFLADYATVEAGKLTVVGASYTYVSPAALPHLHQMSVVGRVRARVGEDHIPMGVSVVAPKSMYRVTVESELQPGPNARPYGNRVGLLWTATMHVSLPAEGLYEVFLSLEGAEVRRLAFDCVLATEAPS